MIVAAWIVSLAVTVLFGVSIQHGLAASPAVIRARRVEIVDARGQPRIILRADDPVKTAAMQVLDYGGIVRLEAYLFGREAAIIDFSDDRGKNMVTLMADARGGTSLLMLKDTSGRTLFKAP